MDGVALRARSGLGGICDCVCIAKGSGGRVYLLNESRVCTCDKPQLCGGRCMQCMLNETTPHRPHPNSDTARLRLDSPYITAPGVIQSVSLNDPLRVTTGSFFPDRHWLRVGHSYDIQLPLEFRRSPYSPRAIKGRIWTQLTDE